MTKNKIGHPYEERRVKELIDKIARKTAAKGSKEDFSQAAARIAKEATKH